MDCSLPGSAVHGIFQAKVLEWGAITFSMAYTDLSPIHASRGIWMSRANSFFFKEKNILLESPGRRTHCFSSDSTGLNLIKKTHLSRLEAEKFSLLFGGYEHS